MDILYTLALIPFALWSSYYALMLWGAAKRASVAENRSNAQTAQRQKRFLLLVPAHNEQAVIAATVKRLKALDYPADRYDVLVGADHCEDQTAQLARDAGALVYERNGPERGGKGALLNEVLGKTDLRPYDVVVIFDADSRVDPAFLLEMERCFQNGARAVQGNHVIANHDEGGYPAMTWAMFKAEILMKNLGRSRLGLSSKNLGDAIGLDTGLIAELGWGQGLTEDFELRQRLILLGERIVYAPKALSMGEAVSDWQAMTVQRTRWVHGNLEVKKHYRGQLWRQALTGDMVALDAWFDSWMPSYSPMMLGMGLLLTFGIAKDLWLYQSLSMATWIAGLLALWLAATPLIALLLDGCHLSQARALLLAPRYMLWRCLSSLKFSLGQRAKTWVATRHGGAR